MAGLHTGLRGALVACLLFALAIVGPPHADGSASRSYLDRAQGPPDPIIRTRVDAFFAALATGSSDAFEAMVREHGTAAFASRRTPAERADILKKLRDDFGAMTLRGVRVINGDARLDIAGATGTTGTITLTLDERQAHRIDGFGVDVQAGGGPQESGGPLELPPAITSASSNESLTEALDAYLTTLTRDGQFSGVVLVARGAQTAFAKGYGLADRKHRFDNGVDTRFNIGSINKSFTQMAIAQLMAAGRLKAADTIGTLLPDYPNADARVATVQQLLDHRAGIADFFGPAYVAADKSTLRSNSDYYALVAPQPLTFAPGTARRYCNGCYIVLGEIITRLTGAPYERYIETHVFAPAGMRRSGFLGPEPRSADIARGYTRRTPTGDGDLRPNAADVGARGSAAGGAYATAADLVAYARALRAHTLLDADAARRFLGPQSTGDLAVAGGAPGLSAFLHARGDVVIVVLANADPPTAERLGEALAARLAR